MLHFDTPWYWWDEEEHFGDFVFHAGMPRAIRSLEDKEVQALLVALLREWRSRTQTVSGQG